MIRSDLPKPCSVSSSRAHHQTSSNVDATPVTEDAHIDGETTGADDFRRAKTGTDHAMTSNICKPNDVRNSHERPKTYVQLHPEFASKPTMFIPDADHKRRMAAANEDLMRRLAIEAGMVNLGQSYDEAVALVARLKELGMDLDTFIKNTNQAKERSSHGGGQRRRQRSMFNMELGSLSINHDKGVGQIKDQVVDGQREEEQNSSGREEWRFWCE
ncbi:hypothetical protein IWZ01DRAFT_483585 [Phyllosticta capitalensis]